MKLLEIIFQVQDSSSKKAANDTANANADLRRQLREKEVALANEKLQKSEADKVKAKIVQEDEDGSITLDPGAGRSQR